MYRPRKVVMWFDESRFTLIQSNGSIRVRREVAQVMHLSYIQKSLLHKSEGVFGLV